MANQDEIWLNLKEYPSYDISNFGSLRNSRTKIKKKISFQNRAKRPEYRINILGSEGKRINIRLNIARTVYKYFKGKLIKGLVIDHKDNNPNNNFYENLQQISQRDNVIKNVRKDKSKLTSKYPGVNVSSKRVREGKRKPFRAVAYVNGKNNYLGYFRTEIEAYNTYTKYLKEHGS